MRGVGRSLVVLVMTLALAACGGDDDNGGGGTDGGEDVLGVAFSESNVEQCASVVIATLSPFSGAAGAVVAMEDAIFDYTASAGATMPEGMIDLGDLGICSTGQSHLVWNDADGNGALSAGDVAVLTLTDCEGSTSGTLNLDFEEVSFAATTASVRMNIGIEETVDGEPETGTLTGTFRLQMARYQGTPPVAEVDFLVEDETDGSQGFEVALNGKTECEVGCFNFYFTVWPGTERYALSEPFGVLRIPGLGVASLSSFGLPALDFQNGSEPESGALRLVAVAAATPCAGVDVPGDGIKGNESFVVLTATGGGGVTLAGKDSGGTPFSIQTAWSSLD